MQCAVVTIFCALRDTKPRQGLDQGPDAWRVGPPRAVKEQAWESFPRRHGVHPHGQLKTRDEPQSEWKEKDCSIFESSRW